MTYTPTTYGDYKASVRVASTGNINIASPGATIDGVTMAAGDRVLLKDQSTGSQNGLWVWNGAASSMTRTIDADQNYEITPGMMVTVEDGTVNADTTWIVTTTGTITVGTTAISFQQQGGGAIASINDIGDVDTSAAVDGSLFRYDTTGAQWQATTNSNLLLNDNGRLQVPTDGTTGGIQVGSDIVLFRATTNEARLEAGDSLILSDGTGRFGKLTSTASDSIQLLRTYDTDGTPGTIFEINETGRMEWGAPASGTLDVSLYRDSAGVLRTDGGLTADTNIRTTDGFVAPVRSTSNGAAFATKVTADANNRFQILAGGTVSWGAGTAATDTNLYRSAADVLKTDDSFIVGGDHNVVGTLDVESGLIQYGNFLDKTFYWTFGANNDTDWYKIADLVTTAVSFSGIQLVVDYLYTNSNFGSVANVEQRRFVVAIRGSSNPSVLISGPDAEYVRVVETATDTHELQVRKPDNFNRFEVKAHSAINLNATITYDTAPAVGSTVGTIYTPTTTASGGHVDRFVNVEVAGILTAENLPTADNEVANQVYVDRMDMFYA